ncbi:MAG: helicase HerA-like domain-containing protein, partial [Dokdonella sp.]
GEALVTTLQDGGVPLPVQRTMVVAPGCRIGTITAEERALIRSRSPLSGKYDTMVDRESACEKLAARAEQKAVAAPESSTTAKDRAAQPASERSGGVFGAAKDMLFGTKRRQGMIEAMAKSAARNAGGQISRSIMRGVLGGIFKSR